MFPTVVQAPASPAGAGSPVAADPIAEAPEKIWYVRPASGGQFGPAAGDIMRGWLTEGRVSPDAMVWREGWRDWLEAAKVFPQFSGNAPAVPSPTAPITPSATAARSPYHSHARRPSDRKQLTKLILLSVLVVVLLGVFLWVLIH